MKKIYVFIVGILSMFLSITSVEAKSFYTCNKEVAPGENIKCSVTIDDEPVTIESDGNIKIYNATGNKFSKLDSYRMIFYESGTIYFGPADDKFSKYIISLYTEDGLTPYANDIRVSVISKTTSKKTTTTTTTTTTKKKSSNNNLSSITINDKKLEEFSKNETRYYLTYPNDVKKAVFKVEKEDETAKVEISGPDFLEVGDNEYTIGVTSEDDTTKFYKVIITRKDVEASSNTNISNITIKGYDLKVTSNAKTYYLTIKNDVKSLDIEVETEDENATYKITGNKNLEDGSTIKINITAENNDEETYRIIINKEKQNTLVPYLVISMLLFIIILIIVIVIIKKKRKKKKVNKSDVKKDVSNVEKEDLEKTKEVKVIDDSAITNNESDSENESTEDV